MRSTALPRWTRWISRRTSSLTKATGILLFTTTTFAVVLFGQAAGDEVATLLQQYVRIDTSNPPGDTRKAADFIAGVLEREGIPVTRYESSPGKAIVYGRLKATVSPPAEIGRASCRQ